MQNNNLVGLVAVLAEKPRIILDAPEWERKQYEAKVKAPRRSGVLDEIVVRMPATAIGLKKDLQKLKEGTEIMLGGSMGSENVNTEDEKEQKVKIFVLADFVKINEPPANQQNDIHLEGNVCKKPVFRQTPKTGTNITELIIAVNKNNRAAFIPVVCWEEVAEVAASFEIGQHVVIRGRLQSREYTKKIKDIKYLMTAYEVSVKELGYESNTIEEMPAAGAKQSAADGATEEVSKQLQQFGA